MQQRDKIIVELIRRAADDLREDSRNQEVGQLANKYENDRDRRGLQINVWAQELGPGLNLFDGVLQLNGVSSVVSGILLREALLVVVLVRIRHAVGCDRRLRFGRAGYCRHFPIHAWLHRQPARLRCQYLHKLVRNRRCCIS